MIQALRLSKLFLIGIFLSSLILSPFVLDFTLVARFTFLAIIILAFFIVIYRSNVEVHVKIDLILLLYLGYILWNLTSLIWAQNKAEALFEIAKQGVSFLVFVFTYFTLKKDQEFFLQNLFKISIFIFLIEFITGYYQFVQTGLLYKEAKYAITGLNGHKNLYTSFLFLNLLFLILATTRLKNVWKPISIGAAILCTITILVLKTKAVYVGLAATAAAFVVLFLLSKIKPVKKIHPYIFIFILIILANVFFLYKFPALLKNVNDPKSSKNLAVSKMDPERLVLWNKTYTIFNKSPMKGVGVGNWQIHFPDATLTGLWRAEDLNVTFQRPHNDFLWILSESGIVGFNLFILFLATILSYLFKTYCIVTDKKIKTELLLILAFVCGFFTISFFDFPKERIEHLLWINIILGISYYYIRNNLLLFTAFKWQAGKNVFSLSFTLAACMVFFGLLRYKGEYYARKMLDHKFSSQQFKVIRAGQNALSLAYTIDPTSVPIHWYIGNAEAAMGNYDEAQKSFQKAYKANPYNRNVLNDLASSYVFMKDTAQAIKLYEESARISPRFDEPKLNLAALYITIGNFQKADFWLHSILHDSERRTNYQHIVDANVK
jgi:O-antigen ligase